MSRRTLTIAGALLVLAFGSLGVAAAAQLTVTSTDFLVQSDEPCSLANLSVHVDPTGVSFGQNKSAVQITNYPAACNGQSVTVAVSNTSGSLLTTGTATCSGSPCSISTGTYSGISAANASVLVNTWGVPSSWDSSCSLFFFNIFMNCS